MSKGQNFQPTLKQLAKRCSIVPESKFRNSWGEGRENNGFGYDSGENR